MSSIFLENKEAAENELSLWEEDSECGSDSEEKVTLFLFHYCDSISLDFVSKPVKDFYIISNSFFVQTQC